MEHREKGPDAPEPPWKRGALAISFLLLLIIVGLFLAPYRGWRNRREERKERMAIRDPDDEEEGYEEKAVGYLSIILLWIIFSILNLFDRHAADCACPSCREEAFE